jgi:hypothetical protein
MIPPRYRTLDGDEVELPLAMGSWVLVPRALARFDPELAWTLDYEDAPEPEAADSRLDFSAGVLLVPVERWNEHAALEPNLAPSSSACSDASGRWPAWSNGEPIPLAAGRSEANKRPLTAAFAGVAARGAALVIAALAVGYVVAVGAWLWNLRDGITGPDVSTGLILVGAAVLLAWLAGLLGAGWPPAATAPVRKRRWPDVSAAVLHVTDDPLAILRVGLVVQLTGFAALVIVR